MKISINWLKEYVQTESNPNEISRILTNLGLEVEKIDFFETVKGGLQGLSFLEKLDGIILEQKTTTTNGNHMLIVN